MRSIWVERFYAIEWIRWNEKIHIFGCCPTYVPVLDHSHVARSTIYLNSISTSANLKQETFTYSAARSSSQIIIWGSSCKPIIMSKPVDGNIKCTTRKEMENTFLMQLGMQMRRAREEGNGRLPHRYVQNMVITATEVCHWISYDRLMIPYMEWTEMVKKGKIFILAQKNHTT